MLDTTFAALSDPTRRTILDLLAEREHSVGELVDHFPITQSAVSRHLNVLEQAALIERRRDGQRRLCALRAETLAEVDRWMERYRRMWVGKLQRLDRAIQKRAIQRRKKR
ncbi:helix-turn-helix transcriptional regulator [Pelagibius sp.]|uniref:ArsR/SmtB family transcription factor n=1 Tax=Pelagibius sp. TaxID=1931238 RepID=UPI00260CED6E|nr:metalloregulator ArsR/SmtB family transcription factor [Pelagibius sp.]